jgi:uroporphyrinogen decarboxylase
MTPRDIVRAQIGHRETASVPYTLGFEPDVVERLNEHYGGEAWRERIVPYIVQLGGVLRDTREFVDESHFRDAFGTLWRIDRLPAAVVEPALKEPTFEGYDFPTLGAFIDPERKDAVRRNVAENRNSFTVVSTKLCLWESWYVRGFQQTMMDCVTDEGFYAELLDRFTELTLAIIDALADVPADAVMMGDDWGNQRGVMIGPDRWRRLTKPRYARIYDAIHAQGKIAITHCCGSFGDILGDIVEIGLDVIESCQPEAARNDPYRLKAAWGDRIAFWGGLGSQSTIPFGTPDELRAEIRRLRTEMSRGGGYILAPAKPLRPETPTENAIAVFEEFTAV